MEISLDAQRFEHMKAIVLTHTSFPNLVAIALAQVAPKQVWPNPIKN